MDTALKPGQFNNETPLSTSIPKGYLTANTQDNPNAFGPNPQPKPTIKPPVSTPSPTPTPTQTTTPSQIPSPTTTEPTKSPEATTLDQARGGLKEIDNSLDESYNQFKSYTDSYLNGSIPLNAGEKAQIAGLEQSYKSLIEDQKLQNTGAEGTAQIRGYQTGSAEYDPTFQAKTIGTILSVGRQKVADLEIQMAKGVAELTQAFQEKKYAKVKQLYDTYQEHAQKKADALQKTIDETNKAIKEAQDTIKENQKNVNEIAMEAAKNGATPEVIKQISSSGSVGEAIANSGDYLQSASGDLGEYLFTKREFLAKGMIPPSFTAWKKTKDAQDSNKAYNNAYATAKGKAAGEAVGSGVPLKPLTEAQGKDFTYAQRGSNAMQTVDGLETAIADMNSAEYAKQIFLERGTVTHPYASDTIKQYMQGVRDFSTAVLRRESGASISPSEFETNLKQYFPQPGDDATTLAQKKLLRETAINSFKSNVPNYEERVMQTPSNQLLIASQEAKNSINKYITANPSDADKIAKMFETRVTDMDVFNYLKSQGKI